MSHSGSDVAAVPFLSNLEKIGSSMLASTELAVNNMTS
jgi:hypothetical protein